MEGEKEVAPTSSRSTNGKKGCWGNLVSAPLPLKKLYIETYKSRLEHRKIKAEYNDIYELKTLLWCLRYHGVKQVKSSQWEMSNLQKTIKGLKTNQSIDPIGLVSCSNQA